jgi:hypothetical protein
MAQRWGLAGTGALAGDTRDEQIMARPRAASTLPPPHLRAAHRGVVWLHLSAIVIWLFVAGTLGIIALAGKAVPPAVVAAGLAAAAGHGLFLAAHLYLASRSERRASRAK